MGAGTASDEFMLISLEQIDNFRPYLETATGTVLEDVLRAVRSLDERTELEPAIRSILTDPNETPHGPAEIADILTHKLKVNGSLGIAALILKGKSFPTVRPVHVSHQIYRLEKIEDLSFALLIASGTVLDAAKEEFISTASRLETHYAILDAEDIARLLIGYGFLCPRDGKRISAGRCVCGYSPHHRQLNILQTTTLRELSTAHALKEPAGLVVLPPGTGKTRIAAQDARQRGSSCLLYVAHTHEILDVAVSELEAVFGASAVRRHENARSLTRLSRVNIATIQLLQKNLSVLPQERFDYLVIDEFHHAAATSYRLLIERVRPRFLLGLTATPFRGDRQDIAKLCNRNVVVNYDLRNGIEMGVLSPYHYYGCFDDIDYSNIRHNGLRYDVRDLEKALVIPKRDAAIISKWRDLALGKATLAFCCSHDHAKRVAASFNSKAVPAEVYISTTNRSVRERLRRRLQEGELRVLCTVDVTNEGADLPFVECLLFLRPTESARIFYQQLGRGLRRYIGKSHCIVIDFIGNFRNAHRIVQFQGLLSDERGESEAPIGRAVTRKAVLNLPLGCSVEFDERVLDLFSAQAFDPAHATRHNIGRILIYEYERLKRRLGRQPNQRDVNRSLRLGSEFYRLVFGSWARFLQVLRQGT